MQFQSKNINKARALFYAILKYSFKKYFEFGSVSPLCILQENNICACVDSIQSGINGKYVPIYGSPIKLSVWRYQNRY